MVLNGLHSMSRRKDRNLHPVINCPHVSQHLPAITHYTHLNILNLASVFKQMGSNYPAPAPLHHENSVYHVQVVIKDNETVTAPYTVLLH